MNLRTYSKRDENTVQHPIRSLESKQDSLVSNRSENELDTEQTLISNVRRSRAPSSCQELSSPNIHGFYGSIPKHITTMDEKYVLHCLELIHNSTLRAEAWSFGTKVHILANDWSNLAETKGSYDMTSFANECSLVSETGAIINPTGDWTIGSINGRQSMVNNLESPLFRESRSIDFDVNYGRTHVEDVNKPVFSDSPDCRYKLSNTLSQRSPKEATAAHKRLVSISSTNSSCSDQSSSSASATSFQGMLQCTWTDGLPHHVFSIDEKSEIYVANLLKVDSSDDKVLDYVYTFHSRKKCKKESDVKEIGLETVATMRVSTSITFCPNNSEVKETQFILSVSDDDSTGDMQLSNQVYRKSKRLTRRVANAFRLHHSYKQRSSSKFTGSSAIFEDTPWEPPEDVHNSTDPVEAIAKRNCVPNLELASIIVKDRSKNCQRSDHGGWGLKFLKKSKSKVHLETIVPSESSRGNDESSISMDVLIPAGLHGGPKTRLGGPSSLTERWISGGRCDCGGWNVGCPLRVLNTRLSSVDSSSNADNSGKCKPFNLLLQGSKQYTMALKMVRTSRRVCTVSISNQLCQHCSLLLSVLREFILIVLFFDRKCAGVKVTLLWAYSIV